MEENVKVFCRVRPPNAREKNNGSASRSKSVHVPVEGGSSIILHSREGATTKPFYFDQVFGQTSKQHDVFKQIGEPITQSCLKGYNCTIFAYGQTGSGKTFTMQGPDDDDQTQQGLIPRVFDYIFTAGHMEKKREENTSIEYTYKCSFLEIYNERVYDLLDGGASFSSVNHHHGLQLREDQKRGIFVEGLTETQVHNAAQAQEIMQLGTSNRKVGQTCMNRESSRSHSVFMLHIDSKETTEDGLTKVRSSTFNLVDLAGSERQKSTEAMGERLKEAGSINKSLSALGNVIMSLVDQANGKTRHVHYRDSKLTYLLKDSLGGNSKTYIIATVSPADDCSHETLSTLKFAQRAKLIQNNAVINEDTSGSVLLLQQEIERLRRLLHDNNLQYIPPSIEDFPTSQCSSIAPVDSFDDRFLELEAALSEVLIQQQHLRDKNNRLTQKEGDYQRMISISKNKNQQLKLISKLLRCRFQSEQEKADAETMELLQKLEKELAFLPDPETIEWKIKHDNIEAMYFDLKDYTQKIDSPSDSSSIEDRMKNTQYKKLDSLYMQLVKQFAQTIKDKRKMQDKYVQLSSSSPMLCESEEINKKIEVIKEELQQDYTRQIELEKESQERVRELFAANNASYMQTIKAKEQQLWLLQKEHADMVKQQNLRNEHHEAVEMNWNQLLQERNNKIEIMKEEHEGLNSRNVCLSNKNESMAVQIEELTLNCNTLKDQLALEKNKSYELENSLNSLQMLQQANVAEHAHEKKSLKGHYEEKLTQLTKDIDSKILYSQQLEQSMGELQLKLEKVTDELNVSNEQLYCKNNEVEALVKELSSTKENLDVTKHTLDRSSEELIVTKESLNSSEIKLMDTKAALNAANEKLNLEAVNFRQTKTELCSTLDDLTVTKETLKAVEDSLCTSNGKLDETMAELASLTVTYNASQERLGVISINYNKSKLELEEVILELNSTKEDLNVTNESLNTKILALDGLKDELSKVKVELERKSEECTTVAKDLNSMKEELIMKEQSIAELEVKLQHVERSKVELRESFESKIAVIISQNKNAVEELQISFVQKETRAKEEFEMALFEKNEDFKKIEKQKQIQHEIEVSSLRQKNMEQIQLNGEKFEKDLQEIQMNKERHEKELNDVIAKLQSDSIGNNLRYLNEIGQAKESLKEMTETVNEQEQTISSITQQKDFFEQELLVTSMKLNQENYALQAKLSDCELKIEQFMKDINLQLHERKEIEHEKKDLLLKMAHDEKETIRKLELLRQEVEAVNDCKLKMQQKYVDDEKILRESYLSTIEDQRKDYSSQISCMQLCVENKNKELQNEKVRYEASIDEIRCQNQNEITKIIDDKNQLEQTLKKEIDLLQTRFSSKDDELSKERAKYEIKIENLNMTVSALSEEKLKLTQNMKEFEESYKKNILNKDEELQDAKRKFEKETQDLNSTLSTLLNENSKKDDIISKNETDYHNQVSELKSASQKEIEDLRITLTERHDQAVALNEKDIEKLKLKYHILEDDYKKRGQQFTEENESLKKLLQEKINELDTVIEQKKSQLATKDVLISQVEEQYKLLADRSSQELQLAKKEQDLVKKEAAELVENEQIITLELKQRLEERDSAISGMKELFDKKLSTREDEWIEQEESIHVEYGKRLKLLEEECDNLKKKGKEVEEGHQQELKTVESRFNAKIDEIHFKYEGNLSVIESLKKKNEILELEQKEKKSLQIELEVLKEKYLNMESELEDLGRLRENLALMTARYEEESSENAKLVGHQNQKQKIQHHARLKKQINHFLEEVGKLTNEKYQLKEIIRKKDNELRICYNTIDQAKENVTLNVHNLRSRDPAIHKARTTDKVSSDVINSKKKKADDSALSTPPLKKRLRDRTKQTD